MPAKAAAPRDRSARAAGFRMPLESDPHERTFMQWPSRAKLYGGRRELEAVRGCIAAIATAIARFEPVVVLANADAVGAATATLGPTLEVWPIQCDDLWCRDSGPTFVVAADGRLAASELNFNGWGKKQDHAVDGKIARRVVARLGIGVFDSGIVGEGGGVEVDGDGTAMAHASSWINLNRNAGSKAEVEQSLLGAIGAERMIWAPGVRGADITDFHIDAAARFVKPGQVVIQLAERVDRSDPWSVAARTTYDALNAARDARGRRLDIVVIREPKRTRSRAPSFVASYVNYYVCNGAVIVGEFGDDRADADAARTLAGLYPGRAVVALNVDPIGEAGGGIHCTTQQQPKITPL